MILSLTLTLNNFSGKDADGWTPLHLAAKGGYKDIVTALSEKGANFDEKNTRGWTPLHLAALYGRTDVVKALLEKGANPLVKGKYGDTPRDLAKDKNIIQLLKEAETKQITSKAIKTGVTLGIITALTVGVGCGVAGIELSILAIAIAAALVIGVISSGITYAALNPSDKLDTLNLEVANRQIDAGLY